MINKPYRPFILVLFVISCCSFAKEEEDTHHIFTWTGFNGIFNDSSNTGKVTYTFDGRTYDYSNLIDMSNLPDALYLKPGNVVDVQFPTEAKVEDPRFETPYASSGLLNLWLRAGVKVVYHYNGKLLERHVLVCKIDTPGGDFESGQFTFDGKAFGGINPTLEKLVKVRACHALS